jgi:hypothetical protein
MANRNHWSKVRRQANAGSIPLKDGILRLLELRGVLCRMPVYVFVIGLPISLMGTMLIDWRQFGAPGAESNKGVDEEVYQTMLKYRNLPWRLVLFSSTCGC